ncbi:MAG: M14 family zinc carboxypeptidase [bacterium]|nr:M14 family zinc carboxypeptidase [bacterium]
MLLGSSLARGQEDMEPKMLIRVDISNPAVLLAVSNLPQGIDVAACRPGEYMDIVTKPSQLSLFTGAGISYTVRVSDPKVVPSKAAYHTYDGIRAELKQIALDHPTITKLDTVAVAAQGGKVWCLKVSSNPTVDDNSRQGILIMGNHHAREWMTPEICLYIANYLTNNYNPVGTDSISTLVKTKEIYIVTSVNPDGFIYDHGGTNVIPPWPPTLLWRKNRRVNSPTVFGVDLNRGYDGSVDGDIMGAWGGSINSYTSPDSSNDVFYGFSPSGEPEQQAMMKIVKDHNIVLSISYHTYSELVLWPLGYVDSTVKRAPDSLQLRYFGQQSAARIKRYRSTLGYTPQQSSALYPTTGDSDGWIYGYGLTQLGRVIFPYCVEADTAFYTPAAHIDSVCPQTLKGFMYLAMRTDSIVTTTSPPPVLPPPVTGVTFPTVSTDYRLSWNLPNPASNPTAYELQELSGFTATTDTVGAAANPNISLDKFVSNTVRMYSGSRSYRSGVGNQFNIASITTTKPYPVTSAKDSFSFYSYQGMTTFDRMWVEISPDGRQWNLLGKLYQNALSWTKRAFAIDSSAYFGKSVFFRIRLVGDGVAASDSVYIDDIKPVASFASTATVSSAITASNYLVTGKTVGSTYYYRVRGYNAKRGWGDWDQLYKVNVVMGPLAVELSAFTAQAAPGGINLTWLTQSENDCYQWVVERSDQPEAGYIEIARQSGQGTTASSCQYKYFDANPPALGQLYYRLLELDAKGNQTIYGPVSALSAGDRSLSFGLGSASPNPFKQTTVINYQLSRTGRVSLKIYNIAGQVVRVLVDGETSPSYPSPRGEGRVGSVTWDGRDDHGRMVGNGVYLYRLISGGLSATKKLIILR